MSLHSNANWLDPRGPFCPQILRHIGSTWNRPIARRIASTSSPCRVSIGSGFLPPKNQHSPQSELETWGRNRECAQSALGASKNPLAVHASRRLQGRKAVLRPQKSRRTPRKNGSAFSRPLTSFAGLKDSHLDLRVEDLQLIRRLIC